MNSTHLLLAEDTRQWLLKRLAQETMPSTVLVSMSAWLRLSLFSHHAIRNSLEEAIAAKGAARRHQDVATIGFHFAVSGCDTAARLAFIDRLHWLKDRPNFPAEGIPSGLLADWASILGIASGFRALGPDERRPFAKWAEGLCEDAQSLRSMDSIHTAACNFAASQIGNAAWTCPTDAADFHAALCSAGVSPVDAVNWQDVWRVATTAEGCADDAHRCVLRLAALQSVLRVLGTVNLVTPTRAQLLGLLARIEHSFLRWPWELEPRTRRKGASAQKWDIQNEYHVQSLLWSVTKPAFPDLEEETYIVRTGQLQPRADLSLLSLKTVIEVKFWYRADKAGRLIEEIASDHSLYLKPSSPYDSMIVVIWDESRRSEEHGELKRGLESLSGILGVVILSRPAKMGEPP